MDSGRGCGVDSEGVCRQDPSCRGESLTCMKVPSRRVSKCASPTGVLSLNLVSSLF